MLLSHTKVCLKYFVNYCSFGCWSISVYCLLFDSFLSSFGSLLAYHIIKAFYSQFHDILRLADVLPNFPFIISEAIHDYCL